MYTILLKSDKSLVASKKVTIYQNDELVDSLCFLVPNSFGDDKLELSKAIAVLTYKDPGNVVHQEYLGTVDNNYKSKLEPEEIRELGGIDPDAYTKYILPVNSNLTKFAGEIALSMTFVIANLADETSRVLMHTGELYVTISPLTNQYAMADLSSFDGIATAIAGLTDRVNEGFEDVDSRIPDDLQKEDSIIKLSVKGEPIGEGVEVFDGNEAIDGSSDGITDLDTVYDSTDTEPYQEDDDDSNINYNIYNDVEWQVI